MIAAWPIRSPLKGEPAGSTVWSQWLSALVVAVNSCPSAISSVSTDTIQAASISATSFPFPAVPGLPANAVSQGRYRVTYEMRKTRAGTASSSLTVTMGWTDGAVACSQAFTALTTNTTAAVQSGTVTLNADKGTAITYTVTYASSGATAMTYRFSSFVEQISS